MIYQNESGALNEAFSDILGVAAEYYYQSERFDWILSEDTWTPGITGDALRYMYDPAADGSSRDHYSSRYRGGQDNGGVHINSGIGNLAFYLTVEGGVHPRWENYLNEDIACFPLGMEKALNIFYQGFTSLSPNATFNDARNACIAAATSLYGAYETSVVTNAWAAVGVGDPAETSLPNDGLLVRGEPTEDLSGGRGGWVQLRANIPANATNLRIRTYGGEGDADMYLR